MISRERAFAALDLKQADRTPADYKAEPDVNERMMAHFGLTDYEDLLKKLQVDVRRLNPKQISRFNKDLGDGIFEDYWGIRSTHLKASHGSYDMHVYTPVWDAQSLEDLERHDWPTPDIFDYSVMKEQRDGWDDYLVMYEGADLFTRPCILRNMENVMLDMATNPEMVHYLLDKFTSFYCEDVNRAFEATGGRIDLYCEWSDFGTQRGLLFSIPMWREFMAPHLKRFIDTVHAGGAKFMLHSCGSIRELIPDFLELGIDALESRRRRRIRVSTHDGLARLQSRGD
ncbi:MAG TPA: uroporphyrinogen decarboxylase family protein, partial [Fimbriimonadaceae bacterium]|nr:uroporphyrinogen decarboxylase family protein [Fimbriimonadaceae bacterium]